MKWVCKCWSGSSSDSSTWSMFASIMCVSCLSCLGVLLRLQLSLASTAASIAGVGASFFYANMLGSALLGFISTSIKNTSSSTSTMLKTIITGIGVGFCGSLTTFSSWMQRSSVVLIKGDVDDAIMVIFIGLVVFFACFTGGVQLANFLSVPDSTTFLIFSSIMAASIVSAIVNPPSNLLLTMAFAPAGALLRFMLSCKLNSSAPSFPVGTFVANMLACAGVAAFATESQRSDLWSAVVVGAMGSLSTTSSFVKELHQRKDKPRFVYAITSIGVAIVIGVVTNAIREAVEAR